jgi:hypothetical protein
MTAKQKGFIGVAVGLLLLLIFGKKSTGQAVPTSNAGLLQGTLIGEKTLFPVSTKPAFGGVGGGAKPATGGASVLNVVETAPGIPVKTSTGLRLDSNYIEAAPVVESAPVVPVLPAPVPAAVESQPVLAVRRGGPLGGANLAASAGCRNC